MLGIENIAVRATIHNVRHALPEPFAYLVEHRMSAMILNRIMQQRGDSHIFVAAVIHHQRTHAQKVRNIRHAGTFAHVVAMKAVGEQHRLIESRSKTGTGGTLSHA